MFACIRVCCVFAHHDSLLAGCVAIISPLALFLAPFLRIGLALYAQFGPGKFPANWWSVAFCVAAYSILTMVINTYSQRVEGDAYLICKPRKVGMVNDPLLLHHCS